MAKRGKIDKSEYGFYIWRHVGTESWYLHADGIWRRGTFHKSKYSGYFKTMKAAKAVLATERGAALTK